MAGRQEICLSESAKDKTKTNRIFVFSSESEGGSMDPSPTKSKSVNFAERIILNVTGQLCFLKYPL